MASNSKTPATSSDGSTKKADVPSGIAQVQIKEEPSDMDEYLKSSEAFVQKHAQVTVSSSAIVSKAVGTAGKAAPVQVGSSGQGSALKSVPGNSGQQLSSVNQQLTRTVNRVAPVKPGPSANVVQNVVKGVTKSAETVSDSTKAKLSAPAGGMADGTPKGAGVTTGQKGNLTAQKTVVNSSSSVTNSSLGQKGKEPAGNEKVAVTSSETKGNPIVTKLRGPLIPSTTKTVTSAPVLRGVPSVNISSRAVTSTQNVQKEGTKPTAVSNLQMVSSSNSQKNPALLKNSKPASVSVSAPSKGPALRTLSNIDKGTTLVTSTTNQNALHVSGPSEAAASCPASIGNSGVNGATSTVNGTTSSASEGQQMGANRVISSADKGESDKILTEVTIKTEPPDNYVESNAETPAGDPVQNKRDDATTIPTQNKEQTVVDSSQTSVAQPCHDEITTSVAVISCDSSVVGPSAVTASPSVPTISTLTEAGSTIHSISNPSSDSCPGNGSATSFNEKGPCSFPKGTPLASDVDLSIVKTEPVDEECSEEPTSLQSSVTGEVNTEHQSGRLATETVQSQEFVTPVESSVANESALNQESGSSHHESFVNQEHASSYESESHKEISDQRHLSTNECTSSVLLNASTSSIPDVSRLLENSTPMDTSSIATSVMNDSRTDPSLEVTSEINLHEGESETVSSTANLVSNGMTMLSTAQSCSEQMTENVTTSTGQEVGSEHRVMTEPIDVIHKIPEETYSEETSDDIMHLEPVVGSLDKDAASDNTLVFQKDVVNNRDLCSVGNDAQRYPASLTVEINVGKTALHSSVNSEKKGNSKYAEINRLVKGDALEQNCSLEKRDDRRTVKRVIQVEKLDKLDRKEKNKEGNKGKNDAEPFCSPLAKRARLSSLGRGKENFISAASAKKTSAQKATKSRKKTHITNILEHFGFEQKEQSLTKSPAGKVSDDLCLETCSFLDEDLRSETEFQESCFLYKSRNSKQRNALQAKERKIYGISNSSRPVMKRSVHRRHFQNKRLQFGFLQHFSPTFPVLSDYVKSLINGCCWDLASCKVEDISAGYRQDLLSDLSNVYIGKQPRFLLDAMGHLGSLSLETQLESQMFDLRCVKTVFLEVAKDWVRRKPLHMLLTGQLRMEGKTYMPPKRCQRTNATYEDCQKAFSHDICRVLADVCNLEESEDSLFGLPDGLSQFTANRVYRKVRQYLRNYMERLQRISAVAESQIRTYQEHKRRPCTKKKGNETVKDTYHSKLPFYEEDIFTLDPEILLKEILEANMPNGDGITAAEKAVHMPLKQTSTEYSQPVQNSLNVAYDLFLKEADDIFHGTANTNGSSKNGTVEDVLVNAMDGSRLYSPTRPTDLEERDVNISVETTVADVSTLDSITEEAVLKEQTQNAVKEKVISRNQSQDATKEKAVQRKQHQDSLSEKVALLVQTDDAVREKEVLREQNHDVAREKTKKEQNQDVIIQKAVEKGHNQDAMRERTVLRDQNQEVMKEKQTQDAITKKTILRKGNQSSIMEKATQVEENHGTINEETVVGQENQAAVKEKAVVTKVNRTTIIENVLLTLERESNQEEPLNRCVSASNAEASSAKISTLSTDAERQDLEDGEIQVGSDLGEWSSDSEYELIKPQKKLRSLVAEKHEAKLATEDMTVVTSKRKKKKVPTATLR